MRSGQRQQKLRMGALPPKYSFVLNPHADYRASSCPRCNAKTLLRKIPLVVHVEGLGLLILRKTCRVCLHCEMVIAHQAEVEASIGSTTGRAAGVPDYLVLGTTVPAVWRRGMRGKMAIDELIRNMADFKAHLHIECTPGGWYPPERGG
jgi:hypothetical protein